ncbi:putative uncharacterized protein DDB_G0282133 [Chenopodium quinoa]|uniref:putative uncharacterized protein DDB_G0282133 n=1 Tax=Chenopodium quinoa TaxID=63459 RepID=UPI000B794EAD|nr:putative uncharacterized protein DDB_G0282133 [Chenopodium quinoa]
MRATGSLRGTTLGFPVMMKKSMSKGKNNHNNNNRINNISNNNSNNNNNMSTNKGTKKGTKVKAWIIQAFYKGLGYNSRMILDSTANGRFLNLDENIASNVVEEMAIHNTQYGNPTGFANKGKHQVDSILFLQTQLTSISQKLDNINNSNSSSVANVQQPQQRYYQPPHQRPQQVVTPPFDSGLSEIKTMLANMKKQMQRDDNITFNLNNIPKIPMLEEKCFSIGVVDVNNFSNKPQAPVNDSMEAVSCVASSAGKTNTWKDEVDAIERAINCVGLGF